MSKRQSRRTQEQRRQEHEELLARRNQRLARENGGSTGLEPAPDERVNEPHPPTPWLDDTILQPGYGATPAADEPTGSLPDWQAITAEIKRNNRARLAAQAEQKTASRLRTPEEMDLAARESAMSDIDKAAAAFSASARKRRKSGSGTLRPMVIAVCVLTALFVVLSAVSMILYSRHNPDAFVQGILTALETNGNLSGLVVSEDFDTLDSAALQPLRNYFGDDGARQKLRSQLESQVVDPSRPGDAFPALSVEKTPVIFGYCDYKLRIEAVDLLVTSSAQNLLLNLDGRPYTGHSTADGVLYTGLMPGRYLAVVTAADTTGQQVTGASTNLELFDPSQPSVFNGALPIADLTISGCVSDEAVIAVNGIEVAQKPENGVVKLPQVASGSTITMTYTAPYGAVTTGTVTFSNVSVTDLVFGDITTTGGIPAASEVDLMLGAYYSSYLNAMNSRDATQLAGVTETLRSQLAQQFAGTEDSGPVYTYKSAMCLPTSLSLHTEGELPAFWGTATLSYTTSVDTSEPEEGTAWQAVEFVYTETGWQLNRVADIDQAAYSAGDTSSLAPAPGSENTAPAASSAAPSSSAPAA